MNECATALRAPDHSHVFLGAGQAGAERRTWAAIGLCGAMMLAALAYCHARRHAEDPRHSFGTGELGDLAGFTSAIVLAMMALPIGTRRADPRAACLRGHSAARPRRLSRRLCAP